MTIAGRTQDTKELPFRIAASCDAQDRSASDKHCCPSFVTERDRLTTSHPTARPPDPDGQTDKSSNEPRGNGRPFSVGPDCGIGRDAVSGEGAGATWERAALACTTGTAGPRGLTVVLAEKAGREPGEIMGSTLPSKNDQDVNAQRPKYATIVPNCPYFYLRSHPPIAATPGKVLPSNHSRNAPPAEDT